jgi:predicted transcriptional regulator
MTEEKEMSEENNDLYIAMIECTKEIVSVYIRMYGSTIPTEELSEVISLVAKALKKEFVDEVFVENILELDKFKDSIKDSYLVCLECKGKYKSLKRHLMSVHQLDVKQYKKRYNLPESYPMVSKNYSQIRSKLAKDLKFGGRNNVKEDVSKN